MPVVAFSVFTSAKFMPDLLEKPTVAKDSQ